jgi:hypothetical protein
MSHTKVATAIRGFTYSVRITIPFRMMREPMRLEVSWLIERTVLCFRSLWVIITVYFRCMEGGNL